MIKHLTAAGLAIAAFAPAMEGHALAQAAPASPTAEEIRQADAKSAEEWNYSVGIQNYVFTLPLTMLERERKVRLNPAALEKAKKFALAAPINQIGHMKTLATADDIMPYTPNNDTVYSGALLELKDEPVILTAPDIADRYWSVEVADAYTNNLFYIGTRATGGKGGNHAFIGPNWKGTLPEGVIEHRVPTNTVMFAIRIGVIPQDAEDLKKVNALQDEFKTTSLSNWGDPSKLGQVKVPELAKRARLPGRPRLLPDRRRSPRRKSAARGPGGRRHPAQPRRHQRRTADGHRQARRTRPQGARTRGGDRAADHEVEGQVPRHALSDALEQPAPRNLRLRLFRPRGGCPRRPVRA